MERIRANWRVDYLIEAFLLRRVISLKARKSSLALELNFQEWVRFSNHDLIYFPSRLKPFSHARPVSSIDYDQFTACAILLLHNSNHYLNWKRCFYQNISSSWTKTILVFCLYLIENITWTFSQKITMKWHNSHLSSPSPISSLSEYEWVHRSWSWERLRQVSLAHVNDHRTHSMWN